MTIIRVCSFEYDDCLAEKNSNDALKTNILTGNFALLETIKKDKHLFEKTIVFIGSNRQSKAIDNALASQHHNGSCFSGIELISKYIPADFDPFLLDDIHQDSESGQSFHSPARLDNPFPLSNTNQKAIIYAQIQKICYEYSSKTIIFNFFSGNDHSLNELDKYFSMNADLIPRHASLQLIAYKAPKIHRYYSLIDGQGVIDNYYRLTTRQLLKNSYEPEITVSDTMQQISLNSEPDIYDDAFPLPVIAEDFIKIISIPDKDAMGCDPSAKFGYSEIMGLRAEQEDALAWQQMPLARVQHLSPVQIGHRLWTTYKILDEHDDELGNAGTTASTTIYDGNNSFITATLGDAASFAVMYDNHKELLGVVRLNRLTHKPEHISEKQRIVDAHGVVVNVDGVSRVNGKINISRAIGDHGIKGKYGEKLICSEAQIDINDITMLAATSRINKDDIHTIKLIVTCDGFTDAANFMQTKEAHEEYLFDCLKKFPDTLTEKDLALYLTSKALKKSSDNISVAIQTISLSSTNHAIFLGIYDGHGGNQASHFVANTILGVFNQQCELNCSEYIAEKNSVSSLKTLYNRDNAELSLANSSSSSNQYFFSSGFFRPIAPNSAPQTSLLSQALKEEHSTEIYAYSNSCSSLSPS